MSSIPLSFIPLASAAGLHATSISRWSAGRSAAVSRCAARVTWCWHCQRTSAAWWPRHRVFRQPRHWACLRGTAGKRGRPPCTGSPSIRHADPNPRNRIRELGVEVRFAGDSYQEAFDVAEVPRRSDPCGLHPLAQCAGHHRGPGHDRTRNPRRPVRRGCGHHPHRRGRADRGDDRGWSGPRGRPCASSALSSSAAPGG